MQEKKRVKNVALLLINCDEWIERRVEWFFVQTASFERAKN